MVTPIWIKAMLRHQGAPFVEISHPEDSTPEEVARLAHVSNDRFAKVVVAVVDGQPAELVLPATRVVDLDRVREALCADRARLATDEEVSGRLAGCDAGAVPPLRSWEGVPVVMDRSLRTDGDIVFDTGTHADAIRLNFRDWYALVRPFTADFSAPAEAARTDHPTSKAGRKGGRGSGGADRRRGR